MNHYLLFCVVVCGVPVFLAYSAILAYMWYRAWFDAGQFQNEYRAIRERQDWYTDSHVFQYLTSSGAAERWLVRVYATIGITVWIVMVLIACYLLSRLT